MATCANAQSKDYAQGRNILHNIYYPACDIDAEHEVALQPNATDGGPYDYTRSGNPTRSQLEAQLADLEGARQSFVYTSGMAALSAVLRLAPTGSHIVAGDDLYGGTSRLLARVAPNLGLEVTHVNTTDLK